MRCTMAQVPAAEVVFDNPALTQFFKDQTAGHCTLQVKRFINGMVDAEHEHVLLVSYTDPELEFQRRLQF